VLAARARWCEDASSKCKSDGSQPGTLRTAGGKNVAGLAGLTGEGLRSGAAEQQSNRAAAQQRSSSRGQMEPAAGHRGYSEAGCW
jgi:hypothetical protein